MLDKIRSNKGFTLIELLVAVGIIGVLATITMVSLGGYQAKARDIRRITDARALSQALERYFNDNEKFPDNTENDCGGWDVGNPGRGEDNTFIKPLVDANIFSRTPIDVDTRFNTDCAYRYFKYNLADNGCGVGVNFAILAIKLESPMTSYGLSSSTDSCYSLAQYQLDDPRWYVQMFREK